MTLIHGRPAEVADRAVSGQWEADLVMGAGNRGAVGTLVERTRRYFILARIEGTDAQASLKGLTRALRPLAPDLRRP